MEYSSGMGIETPIWVITTKSNKKFYNPKEDIFVKEAVEDCGFDTLAEANNALNQLDFGYVVKPARLYRDSENTRIRIT